ncbi:hypothetical protein [Pedobacter antarcticus]|uniref:hypothetical protein n=1 Tax=Pedobacter antarcticus TaxID=34086 RepID=UPI00292F385A|nr:hypothetical protein [Pedobacter antarcticus]
MEKYKTENGVQNVPITIFLNLENEDQNATDFNDIEGEFITWKEHERAYSQDPEYILKSEHERLLSEFKQRLI